MLKIPITDQRIALHGLPWNEDGRFHRLPARIEERVSAELWACAASTSGARLRICTNSTSIGLAGEFPFACGTHNLAIRGHSGLDIYVDGVYWTNIYTEQGGQQEVIFFEHVPRAMREIEIYLPIYDAAKPEKLLLDDDAVLDMPRPYSPKQPVVFYGTSITQGGCASRPGLSYPALLSRMLNIDFVNLGFSGLGRGEPAVAEAIAELDAACVVIDMGQNNTAMSELTRLFEPFYATIRRAHPNMPILVTTPLYNASEIWNADVYEANRARREHIAAVCRAADDAHLTLISWPDAVDMTDAIVDGAHANDIGFLRMAEAMKPLLVRALVLR